MVVRKLKVDPATRSRLGRPVRAELRANLWPVDCQTCGRPLGVRTPALAVDSAGSLATATLHHPGCRRPEWADLPGTGEPGRHLTSRSAAFAMPPAGLPVFVVNPSYEAATLLWSEAGWRVGTLDAFVALGMRLDVTAGLTEPVPGLVATLHRDRLSVELAVDGAPGFSWSTSGTSKALSAAVDSFAGLLVGVTTQLDAGAGLVPVRLRRLMAARRVALGSATVHFTPEVQVLRAGDFDKDIQAKVFGVVSEAFRRQTGSGIDDDPLIAAFACCDGDNWMIRTLTGAARSAALLLVAALYSIRSKARDGASPGEGTHLLVPDEACAGHIHGLFEPVLAHLGSTVTRLPGPGADVVVGTAEQFAAARLVGRLAMLVGVDRAAVPPEVLRPYRRVLAV